MRRIFCLFLMAGLAACTLAVRESPYRAGGLPGWPAFATGVPAGHTRYDNASLAALLVRLTHEMEWGAARPHLVRYERPVRVSLSGPGSDQYRGFLADYLALLARETGIDIATAPPGRRANLAVRFVPGPRFEARFRDAACLVAAGDVGWEAFLADPSGHDGRALARLPRIGALTVFMPLTAPPHLLRGCMIEEIAQALGPANDLYDLGPSIFNDDAAHVWPTRLDLLMLRVLYAPELRTGLARAETERRARAALDRLNPEGRAAPPLALAPPGALAPWRRVTLTVFARGISPAERRRRAEQGAQLATATLGGTAADCHARLTLGRVLRERDAEAALPVLAEAARICRRVHGAGDIRLARIASERAAAELALGLAHRTVRTTEGLARRFAALGQEERLASLFALRAAALRAIQQGGRAFEAHRLAEEWGAYALGSDSEVLARRRDLD